MNKDICNCGYLIIKTEHINDTIAVVLGYKEGALSPWVTWVYNKQRNVYYHGHYFCTNRLAVYDYHERVLEEFNYEKIASGLRLDAEAVL